MRIEIGALVNSQESLYRILLQSDVPNCRIWVSENSPSAPMGWNTLLRNMKEVQGDVAVLCHQDIYLPPGWLKTLEERLLELPEDWWVAGFFGITEFGVPCGRIWDRRMPKMMATEHALPVKALMVDGCCMVLNLHKDMMFNESIAGFDVYDLEMCLKARSKGGSVWIIDNPPEHYATRPWNWKPNDVFMQNVAYLKDKYPQERMITTCYHE